MKWRLANQAQSFSIAFMMDGQFALPDQDSVVISVRGHDGLPLEGLTISSYYGKTQVLVVSPVEQNSLPPERRFENRYIRVDYTVNDVPAFVVETYRLHHFIPHTVLEADVRALFGADFLEIPDADIDIIGAYFSLLSENGDPVSQALTQSDVACLAANEAIALRAAINLCPSIPSRLRKSEKSDTSEFERSTINFQKLETDLKAALAAKLAVVKTGVSGVAATLLTPTIFALSNPTDRITGESA